MVCLVLVGDLRLGNVLRIRSIDGETIARFEFEASSISAMPPSPPSLDPAQLGAYFALIEVTSLLRHAVEQQLRDAGDLSYVQFQLLATLGDSPAGSRGMDGLADGVVYTPSAPTYPAGRLAKEG